MTEKFNKMVLKLAWECKRKMPSDSVWELDDLAQEGWVAVVQCMGKFKTDRQVKLSTYVYNAIRNRLANIVRQEYFHPSCSAVEDLSVTLDTPDRLLHVKQALEDLGECAKDTLNALVNEVEEPTLRAVAQVRGKSITSVHRQFKLIKDRLNG